LIYSFVAECLTADNLCCIRPTEIFLGVRFLSGYSVFLIFSLYRRIFLHYTGA